MADKEDEIGALWVKTSQKGLKYMTGKMACPHCAAETGIVVFSNRKTTDKHPNARIYKQKPRDGMQQSQQPSTQPQQQQPAATEADAAAAGETVEPKDEGYVF